MLAVGNPWAHLGSIGLFSDTPEYKELSRQVGALKAADLRYETTRLERGKSIEQGHKEIAAIQVQIAGTKAQESRLESMIQAHTFDDSWHRQIYRQHVGLKWAFDYTTPL